MSAMKSESREEARARMEELSAAERRGQEAVTEGQLVVRAGEETVAEDAVGRIAHTPRAKATRAPADKQVRSADLKTK